MRQGWEQEPGAQGVQVDTPLLVAPETHYLPGRFCGKKVHSEQNAVEGAKRPRCSGDEARGKVHCRDCMADRKGLATQQRERARLMYAKSGAGRR